jgi:hypothetical protein
VENVGDAVFFRRVDERAAEKSQRKELKKE